jgi:RNA polymerase sigma-70 factor (ECF subfamily)
MYQDSDKKEQNEEDIRIISNVLSGKTHEYDILQKKYRLLISSLIRKMIRNEDDIDDLVQESFIKAFNALDKFQTNYSFSSWLYRIASNTCIDFLRKKRFPTISIDNPGHNEEEDSSLDIKDESYEADISVLANERKKALFDAIKELPKNYREIIELRHEQELDYKEISERMELPLGTVKAHLFRARKMLLTKLKKNRHLFYE